VRAIEQVGSSSSPLLLRQRAALVNDEPEVLGACYGGVLRLEGLSAIPWIARFLSSGDEAAAEAALALSATHSVEAFQVLREHLQKTPDPWFRSVILSAIALTRHDEAMEFLLDVVRNDSVDAAGAIEAILRSGPSEKVMESLEKETSANPRLTRVLAEQRKA